MLLFFACAPSFLPVSPARMGQRPACLRCGVRLLEEPTPEEQERQESGKEPQDFSEDFDAGVAFGQSIKQRFVAPTIDDPGLPYADVLVVTCGTLFVASVVIAGGLPRPSWLVPLQLVPQWRQASLWPVPFQLSVWLLEGEQLDQCSMISTQCELLGPQDVSVVFHKVDSGQELPPDHTIIPLRLAQHP